MSDDVMDYQEAIEIAVFRLQGIVNQMQESSRAVHDRTDSVGERYALSEYIDAQVLAVQAVMNILTTAQEEA